MRVTSWFLLVKRSFIVFILHEHIISEKRSNLFCPNAHKLIILEESSVVSQKSLLLIDLLYQYPPLKRKSHLGCRDIVEAQLLDLSC